MSHNRGSSPDEFIPRYARYTTRDHDHYDSDHEDSPPRRNMFRDDTRLTPSRNMFRDDTRLTPSSDTSSGSRLSSEFVMLPEDDGVVRIGARTDDENVMDPQRVDFCNRSIKRLYEYAAEKNIPRIDTMWSDRIEEKIMSYIAKNRHGEYQRRIVTRSRREGAEVETVKIRSYLHDAIFAITGNRGTAEYSSTYNQRFKPFRDVNNCYSGCTVGDRNPEVANALGLVYHIIRNTEAFGIGNARDRKLLTSTLIINIANCVEDDGHLVCSVGKMERVLQTLQGYIQGICITVQIDIVTGEMRTTAADFISKVRQVVNDHVTQLASTKPDHPIVTLMVSGEIPSEEHRVLFRNYFTDIYEGWLKQARGEFKNAHTIRLIETELKKLFMEYRQHVDGSTIQVADPPNENTHVTTHVTESDVGELNVRELNAGKFKNVSVGQFIFDSLSAMPETIKINSGHDRRETSIIEMLGKLIGRLELAEGVVHRVRQGLITERETYEDELVCVQSETENMMSNFDKFTDQERDAKIRMHVRISEKLSYVNVIIGIYQKIYLLESPLDAVRQLFDQLNGEKWKHVHQSLLPVMMSCYRIYATVDAIKRDYEDKLMISRAESVSRQTELELQIKSLEKPVTYDTPFGTPFGGCAFTGSSWAKDQQTSQQNTIDAAIRTSIRAHERMVRHSNIVKKIDIVFDLYAGIYNYIQRINDSMVRK